jgi:hypothetical protein
LIPLKVLAKLESLIAVLNKKQLQDALQIKNARLMVRVLHASLLNAPMLADVPLCTALPLPKENNKSALSAMIQALAISVTSVTLRQPPLLSVNAPNKQLLATHL